MKVRRSRNAHAKRELFGELEPRQMMAVDFAGIFLNHPTLALSGSTQSVKVRVSNSGDTKSKGSVALGMYAAPDGETFNIGTATFLGKFSKAASLAPGGHTDITMSLKMSAALAAGDYRLYAVADPDGKVTETDEGNNVMQSDEVAIVQPNYDLTVAFGGGASLVYSVVQGNDTNASVPVVVTNTSGSSVAVSAGVAVALQIVARPAGVLDDSQDVVLNRSAVSVAVGGLGVGKSKTANVPIQFADTLAAGNYEILAKIDTGGALAEVNEANNTATFSHGVSVAAPFSDPGVVVNPTSVIPTMVVADGRSLTLKVSVTNLGNVTIPAGMTGSMAIMAHNVGSQLDTPLKTFTVQLGGLGPGKSKTFTFTATVLSELENDEYSIDAVLTTGIAGDVEENSRGASATTMTVGDAFYNLEVLPAISKIPPAVQEGVQVPGIIDVRIKNLSNTKIPSGTKANVVISLRPQGAVNSSGDIPIGTSKVSIVGLGIGGVQTFHLGAKVPATFNGEPVDLGTYEVVTSISVATLTETTLVDNESEGDTITIAEPFTDLAIVSASHLFPAPSALGRSSSGQIVLRNEGNLPVQGSVLIEFIASPTHDVDAGFGIGSRTVVISLLPGQSSVPLGIPLTLTIPANGLLATEYVVFARIAPSSFADAHAGNNLSEAGTLLVSSQQVDLRVVSATNPFGSTPVGGATGIAQVVIGNFGSGICTGDATVTFYVSLGTTLDGSEIPIGSQVIPVDLGGAQFSTPTNVNLELPSPLTPTTYRILAKVTASSLLDNNPNNNVTGVIGVVNVGG